MKSLLSVLVAAGAAAFLSGCAYPVSETGQGDKPSGLTFADAPAGASIIVDGAPAGLASSYDGKHAFLQVAPGTHQVRVVLGSSILFDKPVFVGASSHVAVRTLP